jgi:glycosyltransferase involved in cell wall biosynthesis
VSAAARIAIVTPWFGLELRGGAEQQSWQLAHQLTARGHAVDVLATCCAGFNEDWASNGLRAGIERRGLLTIRRFRTIRRDRRAFERVNSILTSLAPGALKRGVSPVSDDDARLFYENNINSPGLYGYLAAEGHSYSHVLFLPYLYGPTLFGLPLVAERAYLQPCLHDEAYAYLPRVAEAVHAAKGMLFNSEGEYELALRLFGPGIVKKSMIIGEGVDVLGETEGLPEQVGPLVPAREKYLLYLGRQNPAKNVPLLVSAFAEFRRRQPASNLRLVLAGERPVSYGDSSKGIIDLGPVSEAEKSTLLRHARALAQPSTSESFSRVIHEAWMCDRPVIVHADCLPTVTAVTRSGGGFTAASTADWVAMLERVDFSSRDELDRLGRLGRTYAEYVSAWPAVIARYEGIFETGRPSPDVPEPESELESRRILQVVPVTAGPATHAYSQALGAALGRAGCEAVPADAPPEDPGSDPVIRHRDAVDAAPWLGETGTVVIYHAAGRASAPAPVASTNGFAHAVRQNGSTHALAHDVFTSSPAVARELDARHVHGARFLPVCVDPRQWDAPPDMPLISALQDGKHNLLYAGPIDSLTCLNELLIVFLHYLTLEREARLTILGTGSIDEAVYKQVFDEIKRLELVDRVLLAREISNAQQQAIFRAAHAFVSLDEAENSGLEFLHAMWFDVPIVAYRTAIARELVGSAGLLINDKSDLLAVAALVQMVAIDAGLRAAVIAAQRRVRERCDESGVVATVLAALGPRREPVEATEAKSPWPS